MCAEKCRLPCLYTRSKSACRSSRTLRGNLARLPEPDRPGLPFGVLAFTAHNPTSGLLQFRNKRELLAEAGLSCNPLAALGAPARDHGLSALGLHTRAKSVRLRAMTAVGLKCALRHEKIAAPDSYIRWRTNVEYK